MTSKTALLLTDPHPKFHIVLPCTEQAPIAEAVSMYTAAGLINGECVVLIITREHRKAIEARLLDEGIDLARYRKDAQLIEVDAAALLDELLVSGHIQANRFHNAVDSLLANAKLNSPSGRVRVFGEMVSLLYHHNLPAAAQLEELWNAAVDTYSIPLLCAYALDGQGCSGSHFPQVLRELHTHTVEEERQGDFAA